MAKELAAKHKERIINYLKAHPEGVTSEQVTKALKLDANVFLRVVTGSLATYPIAYDRSIDDKYYWIGSIK